jgi:hypothetical protein
LVGFDVHDRDQRQAEVAHLPEQAVQRGLVDDGAVDDGRAVVFAGEAQPVKPGGPPRIEVPLEADLVASERVVISVDVAVVLIVLPSRVTHLAEPPPEVRTSAGLI